MFISLVFLKLNLITFKSFESKNLFKPSNRPSRCSISNKKSFILSAFISVDLIKKKCLRKKDNINLP
jgi:hypothetical protein